MQYSGIGRVEWDYERPSHGVRDLSGRRSLSHKADTGSCVRHGRCARDALGLGQHCSSLCSRIVAYRLRFACEALEAGATHEAHVLAYCRHGVLLRPSAGRRRRPCFAPAACHWHLSLRS